MAPLTEKNNQAKNEIFRSIRRSLAESAPFDESHRSHHEPRQQAASPVPEKSFIENAPVVSLDSSAGALVESFRANLESVGGSCRVVSGTAEAAAQIQAIIENIGAKRIALSDSELIKKIHESLKADADFLKNAPAEELFDCDLGITAAQFGIAETGTLVLESEKEFSRLASLVPAVHVCLLEAKNIRRTLGEVLEILERDLSPTVTFITGPSRTSDIELTLAIGVHGPAQLHVLVIDES